MKKFRLSVVLVVMLMSMLLISNITTAYAAIYTDGDVWIDTAGNTMTAEEAAQWAYATYGEGFKLTRYKGQFVDGQIVGNLPETINGKPVVYIEAFKHNTALVIAPDLPSTLTSMYETFLGCTKLTTIGEIPYGVKNMYHTFYGCSALTSVGNIPDSVTDMNSTFYKCTSLESVGNLSNSVESLFQAFFQCSVLTSVGNIPDGVTNMYYTFAGCTSLVTPPNIPSSVTTTNGAFAGCSSLKTAPIIPDGVTDIGSMFRNASVLEGDVEIPDSVTHMSGVFEGTSKPINMIYSSSNTAAANATVPNNVTKVVRGEYSDTSNPSAPEAVSNEVSVSVKASTDVYTLEVGETLQLEATVSNPDLEYQWIVQDIFDTDTSAPYATIDNNGLITAVNGPGYVIAGLLVKFEDGTEHGYGMILVEITKDKTIAAIPNDFRTGTISSSNPTGITVPYGGSGSYNGGYNPSYSFQSTGYTTADQLGSVSISGGGTGSGSGGSTGGVDSGTGGAGGSGTGGGEPIVPTPGGTGSSSVPAHTTTTLDKSKYTEQSDITGEIVDKFVNYLRVGKGNQFEIVNLNPSNYDKYKLVSLSLTEQPSVVVTQDGYATAVYEGASIIVLADENDKVIDWHLVLVGDTDTYDGVMPDYNIEDMEYESRVNIGEGNMPIYGKIESLQMIDVTLPIQMTFTIDTERLFHAPDAEIVSNFEAPLEITIIDVNKSENAPTLVAPDTYTDDEWNNLGVSNTQSKLALLVNGYDISTNGNKIGELRSAFVDTQTMNLSLTAKYGKAWNNTEDVNFTYNLVFEFAMPE